MFGKKKNTNYEYYIDRSKNSGTEKDMLGPSLSFSSREAYKQLRTNLDFTLSDVDGSRAIGITSAMRGDGKSLSAINLSYSLAEDGYKTILIEGDLRIPTLAKKLGINNNKGLTSLLSAKSEDPEGIEACFNTEMGASGKAIEGEGRFDILVAGEIPPNPQEMLGSKKMEMLIERLRQVYDYIIMDLPPVTAVADALVASRYLDGLVLIVRHDHTEKGNLSEAIRQIEFSGARILGFVFNAASDDDVFYSKRYKYRNRYKGYKNYRYGYGGYSSHSYGYYSKERHSDRHSHSSASSDR